MLHLREFRHGRERAEAAGRAYAFGPRMALFAAPNFGISLLEGGASFRAFSPLKTKGGILVHPHQALARSQTVLVEERAARQWRLARLLSVRLAGDHREAVGGAFPARDLLLDPCFHGHDDRGVISRPHLKSHFTGKSRPNP